MEEECDYLFWRLDIILVSKMSKNTKKIAWDKINNMQNCAFNSLTTENAYFLRIFSH